MDSPSAKPMVLASLIVLFLLTLGLSFATSGSSAPATTYGRPAVLALASLLYWQGRAWSRWLILFLSLGVLLAGPIALGNGMAATTTVGITFWTISMLAAVCLYLLCFSAAGRSFLASRATPSQQAPVTP